METQLDAVYLQKWSRAHPFLCWALWAGGSLPGSHSYSPHLCCLQFFWEAMEIFFQRGSGSKRLKDLGDTFVPCSWATNLLIPGSFPPALHLVAAFLCLCSPGLTAFCFPLNLSPSAALPLLSATGGASCHHPAAALFIPVSLHLKLPDSFWKGLWSSSSQCVCLAGLEVPFTP